MSLTSSSPASSPVRLVDPVHIQVQGRARLRVVGLQRQRHLKLALEQQLAGEGGIHSISADVWTGNVLVVYDAAQPLDCIVAEIEVVVRAATAGHRATPRSRQPEHPLNGERVTTPFSLHLLWNAFCGLFSSNHSASPSENHCEEGASGPVALAESTRPPSETSWHLMTSAEVAGHLGTPAAGLSPAEAAKRVRQYGPNALPRPRPRSGLRVFLNQFLTLPVALLAGSAVLSIATGGAADAAVIMLVVLLNAAIGCVTELQAEKTISALTELEEPRAKVLRDGAVEEIGASQLTVGDVLVLTRGAYVPADARLLTVQDLTVAESVLTGESMPIAKTIAPLLDPDLALGDRINMIYRGTIIVGGSGRAIVVAIGGTTEIGQIQALITQAVRPSTPLERQLDVLGRQLVLVSCAICGAVFLIGLLRGYSFLQMLRSAVSLAVAAVPEGLPTVATTTLAFGIWRMRKQHIVARRLDAIETLGAVEVLCFDKTGTLTMNRMSVVEAVVGKRRLSINGNGVVYEEDGTPAALAELGRFLSVAVLCNEAEFTEEKGTSVLNGSPTENALIEMALQCDVDVNRLRRRFPLLQVDQRTERHNYMATLHRPNGGLCLLAVKGSPGEVLEHCRWYHDGRRRFPLNSEERARIEAENERMGANARRVLGLAYRQSRDETTNVDHNLTWVGLAGLADPPREGVHEAIQTLHQAEIATRMITGDQRAAAYAIGSTLGLSRRGRKLQVIDSGTSGQNAAGNGKGDIADAHIFARVSPSDKLQIVEALRRNGKVVAMTGDGVNDGPALKAANVGIAMGKEGAETAREVADVILLDDDLRALVAAIREGRTIHDNIQRAVHYITATNLSEILTVLGCVAAGLGQPLTPRQLLWINVLSDVFPGLALAVEPAHADVMKRPPRDPNEPLIGRADYFRLTRQSTVITAAGIGGYLYGLSRYGAGASASTLAFLALTTAQLLHTTSARSNQRMFGGDGLPPNKYVPLAVGGGIALQALALVVPPLRAVLGLAPIGIIDALVCLTFAGGSLLVNEISKSQSSAIKPQDSRPRHGITFLPSQIPAA